MNMDLASLHKILKDPTRRNIVLHLTSKDSLAYMELMNLLEITNTGRFNYHLKILGDLIQKGEDGKYRLTDKGRLASQLLQKFPEKTVKTKPLAVGDALLIGIAGFLFFVLPLISSLIAGFLSSTFLTIYELLIPGAVMWWLTVRRAKGHDFYDLLKPPLVPVAIVIGWIVVMWLTKTSFSITSATTSDSNIQITMILPLSFIVLSFFPIIGVVIAEFLQRLLERSH